MRNEAAGKEKMSAKQYLKRIWFLEGRVKREKERIATLRAVLTGMKGIAYDADKVQTSPSDPMSEKVGALVDLERKTMADIVALEEMKSETLSVIHTLDDELMEQLLYLRYLHHKNFYEISAEMNYSLRQLHKLHSKALREIEERVHKSAHSDVL